MVLVIVLLMLMVLLVYLLLTPISFCVDTRTDQYLIQQKGVVKASVLGDEKEVFKVKVNTLFFRFYLYPLRVNKGNSKPKVKAKKKTGKQKFLSFKTGLKLLKAIKVKTFWMDVDTGDCILNAKLYPAFAYLNYKIGGFNINFQDRNQLVLNIQVKPIHIIKSFINF
ncbi:hypothetical protein EYD45_06795 [Hyunsoonleella flava]|uniref:DUF2953 domain-containing protein n=1 Tax=Hyunsoonleella flava TaxID=2527939 RepID=A0A4Q9FFB8_9FLAO|nr:hypothetical protein [Hyunsoonleella flava]TBN04321.1 hypothetical protein EYD45_06795 [Hyunsoonleella flava]